MRAGTPPAVRLSGIRKRFGATEANRDVDLEVAAGSIHGIVGENGAGKSTLMAVLYGLVEPDAGDIAIAGSPVRIGSSRDAIRLGIGMVHQHFMLVETLSALENVILGAESSWSLPAARRTARARIERLMRETGLAVQLDEAVEQLPVGERQRLEILKALYRGARVLILDEPTAVLTPHETTRLFDILRELRAAGTTVLLISHKLGEIFALCDRVTVMRAGRAVLDGPVAATTIDALAEAMVGRRVQLGRDPGAAVAAEAGMARLEAIDLRLVDSIGVPRLDGVTLRVHGGEIVGIAGVAGNGQSELLEVLSGMRAPRSGTMTIEGSRFEARRWPDARAVRALRVAHVPEDRQRCGLVLAMPAWESAALGRQHEARWKGPFGALDTAGMRADAAARMAQWDVRPPDPLLGTASFSGGNQQKLVLAREAGASPRVLLVGQPTRGVDIGAVEFIHARLRALRDAGCAILLVSSDLDEVLALADRVLVMDRGRVTGERTVAACDATTLGRLMADAATA